MVKTVKVDNRLIPWNTQIMKLPKELTTVTKLSKYLAMVIFIAFPFIGFFLGMRYAEMLNLTKRQQMEQNLVITRIPTPTPPTSVSPAPNGVGANWKTYTSTHYGFSIKFPRGWIYKEYQDIPKNVGYLNYNLGELEANVYLNPDFTVKFKDKIYSADGHDDNIGIYLQIFKGKKETNLDEFAQSYIKKYLDLTTSPEYDSPFTTKQILSSMNKEIIKITVTQNAKGDISDISEKVNSDFYFYMNNNYSIVLIPYALGDDISEVMIKSLEFQKL